VTSLSLKCRFNNRTLEVKKEERQHLVTVLVSALTEAVGTERFQKSDFSAAFFIMIFWEMEEKEMCYITS